MANAMFGFCKSNSNIPISHLDYAYIRECNDSKELENLLKILRSGEEGHFPDLTDFTERRLEIINPKSKFLQKEAKVKMFNELQTDEGSQLLDDLLQWSNKIADVDKNLLESTDEAKNDTAYPPIRQINKEEQYVPQSDVIKPGSNSKKNVAPRSYNEWDKLDVESEVKKVDEAINETSDKTRIHNKINSIPTKVEISQGLTEEERIMKADLEKEKGNEAFRAGDFNEALVYYNRSIMLQESAAVVNNRAITCIKMEKFEDAIVDCEIVLKLEPSNVKALLRRGIARKSLKRYEKAAEDFSKVLELAPSNKRAQELFEEVKKVLKGTEVGKRNEINGEHAEGKREGKTNGHMEGRKKGKRMIIEEIDSSNKNKMNVNGKDVDGNRGTERKKKGKRLKIIEVENADDVYLSSETDNIDKKQNDTENKESKNKVINENHGHEGDDVIASLDGSNGKEATSEKSPTTSENGTGNVEKNKMEICDVRSLNGSKENLDENNKVDDIAGSKESKNNTIMQNNVVEVGVEDKQIPDEVLDMKNEGNALFKAGRYPEAENKYSEAIDKLQKEGQGHEQSIAVLLSNRASCKLKIGDCKGCVKDATESLKMKPTAKALLKRAASYEHLENYRYAYADYQSALQLDKTLQAAWNATSRLSNLLMQRDGPKWREHLPKSESYSNLMQFETRYLENAVKNKPSNNGRQSEDEEVGAQIDGIMEGGMKNSVDEKPTEKEMKDKENKEKDEKEKFQMIKDSGNKYVQKKEYEVAIKCYSECIEMFPSEVACYTNRALCFLKLNQFENAEIDASKALSIQNGNVKALFRRALARKALEKYEDSINDLQNLLQVDKSNTAAKKEIEVIKKLFAEEPKNKTNSNAGKTKSGKESQEIGGDEGKEAERIENNDRQSKIEEVEQSQVDKGNKVTKECQPENDKKEYKKKGKRLKIIEVENYDEIEAVEKRSNTEERKKSNKETVGLNEETKLEKSEDEFLQEAFIVESLPNDVIKMINDGDEHFKKGRYADACHCYTDALKGIESDKNEHKSTLSLLYGKRAACKSKTGELKDCIADATESLKLKLTSSSYLIRASAYEDLEKYGNAYVDYMAALDIDPSIQSACNASSRLMKALKERDGDKWRINLPKPAESEAHETENEAVNVVKGGGNEAEIKENEEKKEKQNKKKVESKEDKFNRIKELGNKCAQEGNYPDATNYYSQCIDFFPNEEISYVNRALCYLKLNKPKKAEQDCTKALDLQPNHIKALFRRALARKANGKYRESLQDLTALLKLDSKNTAAKKELDAIKELWREELKSIPSKQLENKNESTTQQKSKKKKTQNSEAQPKVSMPCQNVNEGQKSSSSKKHHKEMASKEMRNENFQRPAKKLNLKKATGFEFLKAWNELKGGNLKDHADLLSQIEPSQLPKVISNKIDVEMIQIIVSCVREYFFTKDKLLFGFNILKYTSKSERFNMGIMFLSTNDLSKVRRVVEEIDEKVKDFKLNITAKEIMELRKAYKAT